MTLYQGKADVQKFVGTLNLLPNLSMIIHPLTELAVLIPLQLGTSARWLIQESQITQTRLSCGLSNEPFNKNIPVRVA